MNNSVFFNSSVFLQAFRCCAAGMILAATTGCSMLFPKASPQPSFYSLDDSMFEPATANAGTSGAAITTPTLIVNPPRAAAGFDSSRIIYVREAHKLEYFARSQWIDTPARMLAPLIVAAVEQNGAFGAVMLTASGASGDIRLDTEILRLQQDFSSQPSRVRFTLRTYIVDTATRHVLASRDLDAIVAADSDDPYAGVVAANRAVQAVLQQLAVFCKAVIANRQAPSLDTANGDEETSRKQ